MFRNLRSRRRPHYGAYFCAFISALLLLLSVSLLYSRLSHSHPHIHLHRSSKPLGDIHSDTLLLDSGDDVTSGTDDRIDELDIVEEEQQEEEEEDEMRGIELDEEEDQSDQIKVSGYYFDHVTGVIRRSFNKRSIDDWDDDHGGFMMGSVMEDPSKAAFGSDDIPVDEEVRRKATQVIGIEDALLLKLGKRVSPLREGWGDWFDKKSDFLRKDRMFKSNLDALNPLHNPMLQDPDGVGLTGLTRGDRIVQKWWLNEFRKHPFLGKNTMGVTRVNHDMNGNEVSMKDNGSINTSHSNRELKSEIKRSEDRTRNKNAGNGELRDLPQSQVHGSASSHRSGNSQDQVSGLKGSDSKISTWSEFSSHIYADGNRWGFYPGLQPHLSFSDFMDAFFEKGKCDIRVFMVWNSPSWMFSVRHQRGLESLFTCHPDACVVMFSETIELDFFKDSFLNDGYKIAVAMPNLDELLKYTPTHVFSSVWLKWRKTKFYSAHYSELLRLAVLYKYGGIYLDSDIIVLKPLSSLNNSVGMEDQLAGSSLNGAVMAFRKHSLFIKKCLEEFYLTYDETKLRWNGAELLTRVAKKFSTQVNLSHKQPELKVQPSYVFFPISSQSITRYFAAPATKNEKDEQDLLFRKILDQSLTFHFWNGLTSSLMPEPESLVTRIINHQCIRCSDIL